MKDVVKIQGHTDDNKFIVHFEDGTKLTVIATIPKIPPEELTSRTMRVHGLETGEERDIDDDGWGEELQLELETSAKKLIGKIYHDLIEDRVMDDGILYEPLDD